MASSDVTAGNVILATEYNNLREEVVNITIGHRHDGSDSRLVLASDLVGLITIRKSADELVDNSITLQNDDDFSFAIAANENWVGRFVLIFDDEGGGATPGVRLGLSLPSGCVFRAYSAFYDTSSDGFGKLQSESTNPFFQLDINLQSVHQDYIIVEFSIDNGSTAGTVQLQWAQNTANTNGTIMVLESYMIAHLA